MEQTATRRRAAHRQYAALSRAADQRGEPIGRAPVAATAALARIDFGRMLRMPMLYWMMGLMAVVPASFGVMTGPLSSFDPWGSVVGLASSAIPVAMGVVLALFSAQDYKSGFNKNIFTVAPKHGGYVLAKILAGGFAGILLTLAYVVGAGATGILLHSTFATGFGELLMGVVAKVAMGFFFSALFMCTNVLCKGRGWLAVISTCIVAMLFAPAMLGTAMMPPVAAAGMSLAAAAIGVFGFRALATAIMNSRDLV